MNQVPYVSQRHTRNNVFGIGCLIVLIIAIAAILYPVITPHGGHYAPKTHCLNNLKQLGTAMHMYQADWGDTFPPLATTWQHAPEVKAWIDKIMVYAKNKRIARCPKATDRLTYSLNRYLSGIKDEKVARPAETAAVFESPNDSPRNNNLNGDKALLAAKKKVPAPGSYVIWPHDAKEIYRTWPDWAHPGHDGATNVLYADGHAKSVQWGDPGPPVKPRLWPR